MAARKYKFNPNFRYSELDSHTAASGERQYLTPYGPAPSVTTILSTLPHPELDAWKERLGEEEANRITEEAANIGSAMHNMLESHVLDEEYKTTGFPEEIIAKKMFRPVQLMGLRPLNEVWGVEVPLYCNNLYAGRTDLIGVYKKKPSVIDYKTSIFRKKEKYIENYKYQLSAYSLAHKLLYPDFELEQGVLLIGIRPHPEFKLPPKVQIEIFDKEELKKYQLGWIDILVEYHERSMNEEKEKYFNLLIDIV